MPKYFFDCFDGKSLHRDLYGIDIADERDIADHGAALAHELLNECRSSIGSHAVAVMARSEANVQIYAVHIGFHGMSTFG